MNFRLSQNPDQLQAQFEALKRPEDIATMLEVSYQDFNYWIYRTPEHRRYITFFIPKRAGTPRRIDAPTTNIKILQQKLNQVLQSVYRPKQSVHGFALGKSVKSNADQHVGRRWVLNLDLKDFFPSINFGRVRGMFMGKPYMLPEKVATVLAHLCCYQRSLPQGAPTSPIVSNMICAQMDSQLQQLARRNRSTYTRYADDMTFSTTRPRFPPELAVPNELNQIQIGDSLREIIKDNGFLINENKVWLRGQHQRQEVTGVTVNKFSNLPRKYTNQIRAMLHAWQKFGLDAAQVHWEQQYDSKHRAPWKEEPPRFEQVLKGKIEYLGMISGQESPKYLKFLNQLWELKPELANGRGTPKHLLLREYEALKHDPDTQRRGYELERIMNSLFEISDIPVSESFRRNSGGEQIDGAFELDGWYYLVECKWRSRMTSTSEIDGGLRGKISRSGEQTMGLFISVNGWSSNVVPLLKQNREKNVFLMNGEDIEAVLADKISLGHLLRAKLETLNLRAEPFISAKDIQKT